MLRWLAALIFGTSLALGAAAEQRFALIIGNEDYPATVGPLDLPHEDAWRIAEALQQAGFPAEQIVVLEDATQGEINFAVAELASKLRAAGDDGVGFFYYSGHGGSAEASGVRQNYLIPAKTPITGAEQLPILGVPVSNVIDSLAAAQARAVFIVSNACRNTLPFTSSKGGVDDKGMVRVNARSGLFIAFATADGATAPDDGLFSQALAQQIVKPGQTADRAFTLALRQVSQNRPGNRLPFSVDGLRGDICFAGCDTPPPVQTVSDRDDDQRDWDRFSAINTRASYQLYLLLHPNGAYRAHADNALRNFDRMDALIQRGAAAPPRDPTKEELLAALCDSSNYDSCVELGEHIESVSETRADLVEARGLFKKACDNGNAIGCGRLGEMMFNGQGGPADQFNALFLLKQACDTGDQRSCDARTPPIRTQ